MTEFTAPTSVLPLFWDKVGRFNRKAAALGLDIHVEPVISEPRREETKDEFGMVVSAYEVVDITIEDVEIRVPGGFTFVAVIEHLGEDGNLIKRSPFAPEVEVPSEYRTAEPTCDHCGIARLRNTTIVVVDDAGEFKRVGSTCAQSYLGIPASKLVTLYGYGDDMFAFHESEGRMEEGTTALSFLTAVAATIKTYGWVSRGVAREYDKTATADIAWTYLFGKREYAKKTYPEMFSDEIDWDAAKAEAEASLEWLTDEIDPESSDYFWNLSVAVRNGFVNSRRSGIVASLVAVWQREMGKRIEREAREAEAPSTWFGDVKGRYDVEATLVYSNLQDGYAYGTTDIFAILKSEGHTFWVKTGTHSAFGSVLDDSERGDVIRFKGTVKEHMTSNKGEQVTKMTRCAPLD